MERCPEVVRLGGYRILCSSACQTSHNDQNGTESLYTNKIMLLENELLGKNNLIKRLKRNSQVFEDSVTESENKLVSQIELLTKHNDSLANEVKGLRKKESTLSSELENWVTVKQKLNRNIQELTDLNNNLRTTVETLEIENVAFSNDLKELRQKLDELQKPVDARDCGSQTVPSSSVWQSGEDPPSGHGSTTTSNVQTKPSTSKSCAMSKRQTLVIGDENVRGFTYLIKQFSQHKFDVNCQWQRRITISEIISLCSLYSKNFTRNDFVVVFLGSEHAIKGITLRGDDVKNLFRSCEHTNLILIGPPLHLNRPVLNRIIEEHNTVIVKNLDISNQRVYFLPLLCYTSYGYLNYSDKSNLVSYLCARLQAATICKDDRVDISDRNVSGSLQTDKVNDSNF